MKWQDNSSVRDKKEERISISQGIRLLSDRFYEERVTLWQDNNCAILAFVKNGRNQQLKDHCNSTEINLPAHTVTHRLQVDRRNLLMKYICGISLSLQKPPLAIRKSILAFHLYSLNAIFTHYLSPLFL